MSIYKPLEIITMEIGGFIPTMEAMRLPKNSTSDSEVINQRNIFEHFILGSDDARLATQLIRGGNDHAKAMRGIIVWSKMQLQTGWMIEFETYRHGTECLSTSSSMHGELKKLSGYALAEQKQRDLSEKVYTRIIHLSYQALRSMYRARRLHRHPDWRIMCHYIETLPYFDKLIYPEFKEPVKLYAPDGGFI
jgi:hypothetical protein